MLISLLLSACLMTSAAASDPPSSSATPCWDLQRELEAIAAQHGGQFPLGSDLPDCDEHGKFRPKRCTGSQCYCVDENGQAITEPRRYTKNRWQAEDMHCLCARRLHEILQSGLIGVLVRCDDEGDYHHTQCTGSVCYCVHSRDGRKRPGTETPIGQLAALEIRCAQLQG